VNIIPLQRAIPQQDANRILLHAGRFRRASDAQRPWAETAKKCTDYLEGRQWSAADLAKLASEKRPALVINKIRPLINLVLGYFINNRTDCTFMPGFDGTGTTEIAQALTHIERQTSEMSEMSFVDAEVFLDGITTGRGFYDSRLSFKKNMLGTVTARGQDQFSTYLDPDAQEYDLNTGNFVMTSRWVSPEEVEWAYGKTICEMIGGFMQAGGVRSGMPLSLSGSSDEISPVRRFGMEEDDSQGWAYADYFHDFIDAARKSLRLLDIQHYVRTRRWFFVDLETGDRRPVPDHWTKTQIERSLAWASERGAPMVVKEDMTRRLRWTHMIGDVIAYDAWAPYDTFTLTMFAPYFRRGFTQGMVEPLLDSQDEINKRRSARLNIVGRSANGGWIYAKGALTEEQKRNLERHGSTPGVQVEWDSKDGKLPPPSVIQPSTTPVAMAQLEQEADDAVKEIAGINDAALGMIDQAVVSGAALERRQRQTIIGLESYIANFRRTKALVGVKHLELYQQHYTEQRIVRYTGPGRTPIQQIINQRTAAGIVNDISIGTYAIDITDTPLSKTFLEAQFEELLNLKQMGMPIPDDFLIDASSVPRKEELKMALSQARQMAAAQGMPAEDAGGAGPGGSRVGPDGGSMPSGGEPGAPPAAAGPPAPPAPQGPPGA
jgi:hypothetical protein